MDTNPTNGRRLLTLDELAREMKVAKSWLLAEARAGRIPFAKAGQRRLFLLEAVERAIAENAGLVEPGE
jgi:excisionase family DNA binding protein